VMDDTENALVMRVISLSTLFVYVNANKMHFPVRTMIILWRLCIVRLPV